MNSIYSHQELLLLLDQLFENQQQDWWDSFFSERNKPIPFFVNAPDENLVEWFETSMLSPTKALEIGCGNGRNAMYINAKGCKVDALDYSQQAISWAKENAKQANATINFICQSFFDFQSQPESYDFIYDSGCFHHIHPHRRQTYIEKIAQLLRPNGHFGLVCFNQNGGSGLTDLEVYQKRSLQGGLGYSKDQLQRILSHQFEIQWIREMSEKAKNEDSFGKDFLWVALMKPRKAQ